MSTTLPPSVNWHLTRSCTMDCAICFGRFLDVPSLVIIRDPPTAARLTATLSEHFEKITLTGGEPLLCRYLEDLLTVCKVNDRTTMVVSNGSPLVLEPTRMRGLAGKLNWFGISIDSARPDVLEQLGRAPRGGAIRPEQYIELSRRLRGLGIRLKLNTVVSRLNIGEDMRWFYEAMCPERVKVFQVMPVFGQNDGRVEDLLVSDEEFAAFVARHQGISVPVVSESNSLMSGSYAMLDPAGRFFDNTTGVHRYSRPVLEVGVFEAFEQVTFDRRKFDERGGRYDWR